LDLSSITVKNTSIHNIYSFLEYKTLEELPRCQYHGPGDWSSGSNGSRTNEGSQKIPGIDHHRGVPRDDLDQTGVVGQGIQGLWINVGLVQSNACVIRQITQHLESSALRHDPTEPLQLRPGERLELPQCNLADGLHAKNGVVRIRPVDEGLKDCLVSGHQLVLNSNSQVVV